MRFLHTSDWHLGRSLHRADLREAQAAFLDHLVDTARAERVDAVLVAGDVYDRAIAPVDAVALCEDALARLRGTGARVILISGNHDSALRLGVNSALIDTAGVHLRTNRARLAEPVVLTDEHGPVAVYGVPYLEPALGLPAETPAEPPPRARRPARRRIRRRPGGAAAAQPRDRARPGDGPHPGRRVRPGMNRTVVMAHAWVAAGGTDDERRDAATRQQSSSERDISVGGIGYVPAALFDGFSYVALGHLHGQQTLADHLRYSGSPLPYSFSEKNHKKGSWLVEVGIDGKTRVERVAAPVYRRLAELSGRIDDLLTSAEYDGHEDDFVAVTLDRRGPAGGGDGPAPPPVPARPHARVQTRGGDQGPAQLPRAGQGPRRPDGRRRVRPARAQHRGDPRSSTSCWRPRSPPPGTPPMTPARPTTPARPSDTRVGGR